MVVDVHSFWMKSFRIYNTFDFETVKTHLGGKFFRDTLQEPKMITSPPRKNWELICAS